MVSNMAFTCILKTVQLKNHNFQFSTQKSATYCHFRLLVNLLKQLSFLIISLYIYIYIYIYTYETKRRICCVSSAVTVKRNRGANSDCIYVTVVVTCSEGGNIT